VKVRREGAEVVTVLPDKPADGELEVGDVIVEANAQPVRSPQELSRAMRRIEPGELATFVVKRGDERVTVELETVASEDDPTTQADEGGRAVVGIIVDQAATFDFPVDVSIDAGDIGGPSAGLAFALDVTDELGETDLDRGRRIAATGEIALDGTVSAIGGVKQKTIAARRVGAAMFLVPDANADEARRYADGLKIVPVTDYDEAVEALTAR
jgi:Lon-like protease